MFIPFAMYSYYIDYNVENQMMNFTITKYTIISNMLFQFQYTLRNKILLQTHLLKSVFTFCHILFIDIFAKYIV